MGASARLPPIEGAPIGGANPSRFGPPGACARRLRRAIVIARRWGNASGPDAPPAPPRPRGAPAPSLTPGAPRGPLARDTEPRQAEKEPVPHDAQSLDVRSRHRPPGPDAPDDLPAGSGLRRADGGRRRLRHRDRRRRRDRGRSLLRPAVRLRQASRCARCTRRSSRRRRRPSCTR